MKHPPVFLVLVLAIALLAVFAVLYSGWLTQENTSSGDPGVATEPSQFASASPAATAPTRNAGCPTSAATVIVTSAAELTRALDHPQPGTVIQLADGVYSGNFTASGRGSAALPITLCGTKSSVLDGGDDRHGYVLHLQDAAFWVLDGFTVRNGQKGVMLDGTSNTVLQNLTVQHVGDEAIHLRAFSSDNTLVGNTISDTGLFKRKFGEGIYVGTAESNWCTISNCAPDTSDRNVITGNTISGTTAESVDIKEGTTGGTLNQNTFDGSMIVQSAANAWVNVKGNNWTIDSNTGTNSPQDGFQTHEILDGWGTGNIFRNNTANVNGPGYGFALTPVRGNIVECGAQSSNAQHGLSNVPCTPI
ncbi:MULTISPECIES: right-handed parallel beta-helix repeat-containing protein [unclassified Cryobacterium]|uniref:right-handed parallel beta-helix repeat-containing protein n=1 Tax=unclassified Cryobacterium TaxID=2649013 RepID=UPI002AB3CC5B|nr:MULTISPECIES: right-handed parallel beta-helix repeat-containing protein [unclassified Cryobacterium]MDY7528411.1 right-handed parallel beta-helix repeat-containing protein [Cryobacterium sp. 10C2]MDY7540831.1 right-handed parallel beta-helix repeat-containing protein [Cryobacterium sp. 5B3]MDY7555842.1 right-handed parallel beta-helix repeat-containing protein [Cryobacterium sp. 10C3]MEB0000229.1 right-handed parallel beta-helix repeat-containing protein [Cryobacterium sp. RTS3]MEB0267054.